MYRNVRLLLYLFLAGSLACGVFEDFSQALHAEVRRQSPGDCVSVERIDQRFFERGGTLSGKLGRGCLYMAYPFYVVTPESLPESTSVPVFAEYFLSKSLSSRGQRNPYDALTLPEWRTVVFLKDEVSGKDVFLQDVIDLIGKNATGIDCVVCTPSALEKEVEALVQRKKRYIAGYAAVRDGYSDGYVAPESRRGDSAAGASGLDFSLPEGGGGGGGSSAGPCAMSGGPSSGSPAHRSGVKISHPRADKRLLFQVPEEVQAHFRQLHLMLSADGVKIESISEFCLQSGVRVAGEVSSKTLARVSIPLRDFVVRNPKSIFVRVVYTDIALLLSDGFLEGLNIRCDECIATRGYHTVVFFTDSSLDRRVLKDQQAKKAAVDTLMLNYGISALHLESTELDESLVKRILRRCLRSQQSPAGAALKGPSMAVELGGGGGGSSFVPVVPDIKVENVVDLSLDDGSTTESDDDASARRQRPSRLKKLAGLGGDVIAPDGKPCVPSKRRKHQEVVEIREDEEEAAVDLGCAASPVVDPALVVEESILDACTQHRIFFFKIEDGAQLAAIPSGSKKVVWIPMSKYCMNDLTGNLKSADELAAGFLDSELKLYPQFKSSECSIIMFNDLGRDLSISEISALTYLKASQLNKATIKFNIKCSLEEAAIAALLVAVKTLAT